MTQRVAVVGGGPAGLTAAIYTARAGLDTTVFDGGEPILGRNAHLENMPGFPAGVNARTFLEATRLQAEEAGVELVEGLIEDVRKPDGGNPDGGERDGRKPESEFALETESGAEFAAEFVVAASWPDLSYLDGFDLERVERGSKTMLAVDEFARTGVDGLYAAGRIARQYHQAVVAAGHGATAGLTVVDDSDVPYYHDWVTPDRYFSGRGREVPPGCEEIEEAERRERERESLEELRELSPAEPPTQHSRVEPEE